MQQHDNLIGLTDTEMRPLGVWEQRKKPESRKPKFNPGKNNA